MASKVMEVRECNKIKLKRKYIYISKSISINSIVIDKFNQ